jgi:hypothetical protein
LQPIEKKQQDENIMTKRTFSSSLQIHCKINFTSCSTTTIVLCASIAIAFRSSMLNLNPINFSSNGFFSLFVSSALVNAQLQVTQQGFAGL